MSCDRKAKRLQRRNGNTHFAEYRQLYAQTQQEISLSIYLSLIKGSYSVTALLFQALFRNGARYAAVTADRSVTRGGLAHV
jgi:hypothetical protein